MNQLHFFLPETQDKAEKLVRLLTAKESKTRNLGLQLAKHSDFRLTGLLKIAIDKHWRPFKDVWNGFERTGILEYCNFNFGQMEVCVWEDDSGEVSVNEAFVYLATDKDRFTGKKYREKISAHISENWVYYDNKIKGT